MTLVGLLVFWLVVNSWWPVNVAAGLLRQGTNHALGLCKFVVGLTREARRSRRIVAMQPIAVACVRPQSSVVRTLKIAEEQRVGVVPGHRDQPSTSDAGPPKRLARYDDGVLSVAGANLPVG